MNKLNKWIYGFSLLVIATLTRAFHLGREDFWLDEIYTLTRATQPLQEVWSQIGAGLHLRYFIQDHILYRIWVTGGTTPGYVRILPLLFGLMSVWLIYRLTVLWSDETTGRWAGLWAAVSPLLIYYSQEARGYTLWIFLYLASLYSLSRLIQSSRKSDYFLYMLSSVLCIYVQVLGVFWVGIAGLVGWLWTISIKDKKPCLPLITCQGGILLFTLPWIYFLSRIPADGLEWIPSFSIKMLVDTFKIFTLGLFNNTQPLMVFWIQYGLWGILCGTGLFLLLKNKKWDILILLTVPLMLLAAVSILYKPLYFTNRYTLLSLPLLIIGTCVGWRYLNSPRWLTIVGFTVLILSGVSLFYQFSTPQKTPWIKAISSMNRQSNDITPICVYPHYHDLVLKYHLGEKIPIRGVQTGNITKLDMIDKIGASSEVWLFWVEDGSYNPVNPAETWLTSHYSANTTFYQEQPFPIRVIHYQKK